jgi:hypothetical protein
MSRTAITQCDAQNAKQCFSGQCIMAFIVQTPFKSQHDTWVQYQNINGTFLIISRVCSILQEVQLTTFLAVRIPCCTFPLFPFIFHFAGSAHLHVVTQHSPYFPISTESFSKCRACIMCTYTGWVMTCGHYCRRWFPRSLWSKKFI